MTKRDAATSARPVAGTVHGALRRRALRTVAAALLAAAFVALTAQGTLAQIAGARAPVGGLGGEHEIYGEFKVDESKAGEKVPGSFVLVLMTDTGKVIERQSAMVNSTYKFFGLRNGNYEIVVESAGMSIARIPVTINSSRKTEVRQNIEMEWVPPTPSKAGAKPGAISTADYYERPAGNQPLFDQALAAVKKKKHEDAVALLRQVVAADGKDHIAWAYLGAEQSALKDAAEAERSYKRALELRPDLLAAALNLGRLYAIEKNFNAAAEVLKPAVEKHPDSADATFLLAQSYLQTGKNDEAVPLFREAVRLDPKGKSEAHLGLAAILNAAGQKDKAAVELEQFLAKQPNDPRREKFEEYIRQNKKH